MALPFPFSSAKTLPPRIEYLPYSLVVLKITAFTPTPTNAAKMESPAATIKCLYDLFLIQSIKNATLRNTIIIKV